MIPLPSDPFETGSRILWERIDFLFKNLRFYKFEEGSLERFLDVPQVCTVFQVEELSSCGFT